MEFYPLWVLLIAAGVTFLTRALPFAVFGGRRAMPAAVRYPTRDERGLNGRV